MDSRVLIGQTGLVFTSLFNVPLRTQNFWKAILEQKCFCVCPLSEMSDVEPARDVTIRDGLLLNAGLVITWDAWVS